MANKHAAAIYRRSPAPANHRPLADLTDRELEVFRLIGEGHGTRQIAEELHLSVKTVESYQAHIKEKLSLRSARELVQHAIQWTVRKLKKLALRRSPWNTRYQGIPLYPLSCTYSTSGDLPATRRLVPPIVIATIPEISDQLLHLDSGIGCSEVLAHVL